MSFIGNTCSTKTPPSFLPDQIDGIIGWYTLSSVRTDSFGIVTSWLDTTDYKNHLVPYLCNTIYTGTGGIYFSNSVLKNADILNLSAPPSGASVFIVADVNYNPGIIQNYVTLFFSNTSISPPDGFSNLVISTQDDGTNNNFYLYSYYLDSNFPPDSSSPPPIPDFPVNTSYKSFLYNDNNDKYIMTGIRLRDININPTTGGEYEYITYVNTIESYNTYYKDKSPAPNLTTIIQDYNVFIGDSSNLETINTSNHGINANIYEIIIYNTELNSNTINNINSYLSNKFNITY